MATATDTPNWTALAWGLGAFVLLVGGTYLVVSWVAPPFSVVAALERQPRALRGEVNDIRRDTAVLEALVNAAPVARLESDPWTQRRQRQDLAGLHGQVRVLKERLYGLRGRHNYAEKNLLLDTEVNGLLDRLDMLEKDVGRKY